TDGVAGHPAGIVIGSVNGSNAGTSGSRDYEGFADVTTLVQAGGNGTYTVANVQADAGVSDRQAGWSLVVVYRAPGLQPRNLTVFDGFASVSSSPGNDNVEITISGFQAPPSGPVNATIGVVGYEGDLSSTGDSLKLNNTTLTNKLNPSDNFFNSTITNLGVAVTAKNPDFVNQFGFDIDSISTTNIILNN